MIRWPLFIIGLGLMACALIARLQQPPLASAVERVNLTQAVDFIGGSTKHFIELEATVDTERRIYATGEEVSRPVYTPNPPDQVYSISAGAESQSMGKIFG